MLRKIKNMIAAVVLMLIAGFFVLVGPALLFIVLVAAGIFGLTYLFYIILTMDTERVLDVNPLEDEESQPESRL